MEEFFSSFLRREGMPASAGLSCFVLVLVWPILLPAGIDTGIGNAF